jgi:hypothetical protein
MSAVSLADESVSLSGGNITVVVVVAVVAVVVRRFRRAHRRT